MADSTRATPGNTRPPRRRRILGVLAVVAVAVMLAAISGCRTLAYYAHVARGHSELMLRRQPVPSLLADPSTDPSLRDTLAEVLQARVFASERLMLPHNRSYTYYVALDRPYVSWNVMAAPEFSVEPLLHCFPFAGCVPYRGWFSEQHARADAARLREHGYETHVSGVPAYSTLGWFADPVVSSMLRAGREQVIGTVFHELAHEKLYLPGDTAFNESYATFVEQQGLREWLHQQGRDRLPRPDYRPVIRMVLALRERLASIYAQPLRDEAMREAKAAAIAAFRMMYRDWRAGEGADRPAYDRWVEAPIDNAKLLPFGLYDHWVPAFEALFAEVDGDWAAFHARAAEIARLDTAERRAELTRRLDRSATPRSVGAARSEPRKSSPRLAPR